MDLLSYDNIAIVVLIIGNIAQWKDRIQVRREAHQREIRVLREDIAQRRAYMARLEESGQMMIATQRALKKLHHNQRALSDSMNNGFQHLSDGIAALQRASR